MGKLVLAAKTTHVPTMLMFEQDGPLKGKRQSAIDGHVEIGRRARAAGADTIVVLDTPGSSLPAITVSEETIAGCTGRALAQSTFRTCVLRASNRSPFLDRTSRRGTFFPC